MKKSLLLAATAVIALCFASCQKEEKNATHFTAGIEQSHAKTYLDGDLLKWNAGDLVKIYGTSGNGAIYTVTPRTDDPTWAGLDYVSGDLGFGPYKAIYPENIAAGAASVTLPAMQTTADGSLVGFPMYAESSTDVFQFKNLCGALKIQLQQSDVTISRIQITAGSNINGTYTIDASGAVPQLANCTNGSVTTTLDCTTAQSVADSHAFYIYLPAGIYTNMQITFYQPDGSYCTKTGTVVVERSVCSRIAISGGLTFAEPGYPSGRLPGLFSVSATMQVHFSQGNLQWSASGSENYSGGGSIRTGTWRFAQHQYDVVGSPSLYANTASSYFVYPGNVSGSDNAYISSSYATYSGWIDLFGWGTSGYHNSSDQYNTFYFPYSTSDAEIDEENNYYGYGPSTYMTSPNLTGQSSYYDWGVFNNITNGGNAQNQWRTLTFSEWYYLRYTRDDADDKYASGRIQLADGTYVNGCIFLPDSWSLPSGCTFAAGGSNNYDDYSRNTYTAAQWFLMESAGAVFLPAAGCRIGTNVIGVGGYGTYWSSSYTNSRSAKTLYFGGDVVDPDYSYDRYRGLSVRLVQNNR